MCNELMDTKRIKKKLKTKKTLTQQTNSVEIYKTSSAKYEMKISDTFFQPLTLSLAST